MRTFVCLWVLLGVWKLGFGQSLPDLKGSPFQFHGTGEISEGITWRQGDATGVAPNFLRLRANATVTVFGLGFGVDGFFTTENAPGRQPMNYLQFSYQRFQLQELAKKRLQEKITNLEKNFNPKELEKLTQLYQSQKDSLLKSGLAKGKSLKDSVSLPDSTLFSDTTLKIKQEALQKLKKEEAETQAEIEEAVRQAREKKVPLADSVRRKLETLEVLRDSMDNIRKILKDKNLLRSWRDSLQFFDPQKLKQFEELQQLKKLSSNPMEVGSSKLRKIGILNKAEAFLGRFKSFNFGTTYPIFTPLTLQGIPVHGFFVEYQPKSWYVGLAGGLSQIAANDTGIGKPFYERWLGAAKFGYGSPEANHLHITLLYSRDKDEIPYRTVLPFENYLAGIDFKISLFAKKLVLEGELNSALVSKNSRYKPLTTTELSRLAGLSYRDAPVFQNLAVFAKSTYRLTPQTKVSATLRRIGTDYITLGVPFLRSDVMSLEGRLDQKIWKNRLTVSTFVRHENDNLENLKPFTTDLWMLGATIGLKVKKYPFLHVTAIVNSLKNNVQQQTLGTITATTGYTLQVKKTAWVTVLNGTWQQIGSLHDSLNFAYKGLTLTELVKINRLTFTVAGSVMKREQYHGNTLILNVDAGLGYQIGKKIQVGGGGTLAIDTLSGKKYGFYVSGSIPITKFLIFNIRGERNIFEAVRFFTGNYLSYKEWLLRSGLTVLF